MSKWIAGERIEPGDVLCRKVDGKIYVINPKDDRSQKNPYGSNNEHLPEFLVIAENVHCGDILVMGIDSATLEMGVVWLARQDDIQKRFRLIGYASRDWSRGQLIHRTSITTHHKGTFDVSISYSGLSARPPDRQGGGDGPSGPEVPG